MRVLIFISLMVGQIMGFLQTRRSSGVISFSSTNVNSFSMANRVIQLQLQSDPSDTPQWKIEGGDTSETECSSSGDIARAAAAAEAARLQAEAALKSASEQEKKNLLALEASKAEAASKAAAAATAAAAASNAVATVSTATTPAPKVDLTKLSVGTDSFDVGLLIAFPIIVATLGFFFLFPLIGPQLAQTLPPVPKM
jgi:hypothetical protein